jgi:hypothetical protein
MALENVCTVLQFLLIVGVLLSYIVVLNTSNAD